MKSYALLPLILAGPAAAQGQEIYDILLEESAILGFAEEAAFCSGSAEVARDEITPQIMRHWNFSFLGGVTVVENMVIPDSFEMTLPARLFPTRQGVDLYVGDRKLPVRMAWQDNLTVNFDRPDYLQGNGELVGNDFITRWFDCPLEEVPALREERSWSGGTLTTAMWFRQPQQAMGVIVADSDRATGTQQFILEPGIEGEETEVLFDGCKAGEGYETAIEDVVLGRWAAQFGYGQILSDNGLVESQAETIALEDRYTTMEFRPATGGVMAQIGKVDAFVVDVQKPGNQGEFGMLMPGTEGEQRIEPGRLPTPPGCEAGQLPVVQITGPAMLTGGETVDITANLHFVNEDTLAGVIYWNGSDYHTRRFVTLTR